MDILHLSPTGPITRLLPRAIATAQQQSRMVRNVDVFHKMPRLCYSRSAQTYTYENQWWIRKKRRKVLMPRLLFIVWSYRIAICNQCQPWFWSEPSDPEIMTVKTVFANSPFV